MSFNPRLKLPWLKSILCLLVLTVAVTVQAEPIAQTVRKIHFDRDWQWILGLNITSLLMHNSQIGLSKMASAVKSFKEETIPGEFLAVPTIALPFVITYWGDERDSFNHFKGYFMAFSVNAFGTELTKFVVERKRPGYDDALLKNEKTDKKSFFSGHASQSFVTATYASLYAFNHGQTVLTKYLVPVILEAAAGYVAYTRVRDNWHHTDDVMAGSLTGATIAIFVYRSYERKSDGHTEKIQFDFGPNRLFVRYRF